MDNFPEVVDPFTPIEVPYLVQDYPHLEYDGLGFADFPGRKGWDVESIPLHTYRDGTNRNELAAFLQSWLFIAAVLDIARYDVPRTVFNTDPIPKIEDLIVESTSNPKQELINTPLQEYLLREDVALLTKNQSGRLVVSLKQLPRRMIAWLQEVQHSLHVNPPLADADRQTQLQSAFSQSETRIELWTKTLSSLIESPAIDPVTRLSILNLWSSLRIGHMGVWENLNNYQIERGHSQYNLNVSMNMIVRQRLLCCGWCPSEISQFEKRWSPRLQYFRSLIKRPLVQGHTGCTETQCKHAYCDPKTYSTRHVASGCCCDHVEVSQQVTDFVKQSSPDDSPPGFPVVRLVDDHIELSDSRNTVFIAISHVWSDGLGNMRANSLPLCQLRRIQTMAAELSDEPISFWIDTLCVPLSKEERKISLINMIEVYQTANKVLVLDLEAEMVEFNLKRVDEAMMHMASSRWWKRLWTMQEGAVAKTLYFRFKNLAVNLKSYQGSMQDYDKNGKAYDGGTYRKILLFGGIPIEIAAVSYLPLNKYWHCRHKQGQSALWVGAQDRTTSHAEDESICFASLAGLPATAKRKLLDIETNKRYKMLLSDIEYTQHFLVPQTILFSNWPKLQEDGLRWAPTSFTRAGCGEHSAETLAIPDRERASNALPPGLIIIAPSIALLPTRLPLGTPFFVATQRGNGIEWFQVWDIRSDAKLPFGQIADQLHTAEKPILIVQNYFPQAGRIGRGVLGYVYEVQEQATLVRYSATVGVCRVLRQRTEGVKIGAVRRANTSELTVQDLEEISQQENLECAHEHCPGHVSWNRNVDDTNEEGYGLDRTAQGVISGDSTWIVG